MMKALYVLPVLGAFLMTPSLAQTADTSSSQPAAEKPVAGNPNEMVCQKQEVTGSRLAQKRVCKTRAQWAAKRLEDRQEIERIQTQRGMKAE